MGSPGGTTHPHLGGAWWVALPALLAIAPRWLYALTSLWDGPRWLARAFYEAAGLTVLILIIAGGISATLGAVIYAEGILTLPAWFGYHEIFHVGTIAGFVCHWRSP